ncbi:unnamed protein product [Heligmosomoides polygyrus]|uniref:DUF4817 domain-containing protein n=1 Tax=Heligmosomoides polygyrus TaxID=6339 RepID=A0A183F8B1_HELPZ|nr:unnamed protein product [Heligmosomoides polygyrus]
MKQSSEVAVTILARERDVTARRTLEAFWIAARNPKINRKEECIAVTQELAPYVDLCGFDLRGRAQGGPRGRWFPRFLVLKPVIGCLFAKKQQSDFFSRTFALTPSVHNLPVNYASYSLRNAEFRLSSLTYRVGRLFPSFIDSRDCR